MHDGIRRRGTMLVSAALGLALGVFAGCAGKGKGSKNPEECMKTCEQERCNYNPNTLADDQYLECLDSCEDECS